MRMDGFRDGPMVHRGRRWYGCEDGRHPLFFRHRGGHGGHGPGGFGGPGDFGGRGGFGGFGGRGEGKRFFGRGEFKFAILELLAAEPMHGYQLIKAMEEKTGGMYVPSAGSIYPNLQLLEDMNLIAAGEADGKKLYRITEEGLAFLQEREKAHRERAENRWERHVRHAPGPRGKHGLRELVRRHPDVFEGMVAADQAAQQNPGSPQAERFRQLMTKLRDDLAALRSEGTDPQPDDGSKSGGPDTEPS